MAYSLVQSIITSCKYCKEFFVYKVGVNQCYAYCPKCEQLPEVKAELDKLNSLDSLPCIFDKPQTEQRREVT